MTHISKAKEHLTAIQAAVKALNEVITLAAVDKVTTELEIRSIQAVGHTGVDVVEAHVSISLLHVDA